MFNETLRSLVAARTADDIAGVRVAIVDAVEAGTLGADAGAALQVIARQLHADIAANGPRAATLTPKGTSATPAAADDRLPAVIREAAAAEYPESGPIVRGVVAVQTDDGEQLVRFRIRREWTGSIAALFGAAGLSPDDDPTQLVGAAVLVTLGTYESKHGAMPVVKRWYRSAAAAKPAQAKDAAPAWEADDAAPRAPRRTAAAKAHAAFKANVAEAAGDDDGIPF